MLRDDVDYESIRMNHQPLVCSAQLVNKKGRLGTSESSPWRWTMIIPISDRFSMAVLKLPQVSKSGFLSQHQWSSLGPHVFIRPNTSICPRLSAAIFVCAENVVKKEVFCIMANFMFYIGTHSIGTCASLLRIIIIIITIIIIIKPLLKIFNECSKSLTGVGELNP